MATQFAEQPDNPADTPDEPQSQSRDYEAEAKAHGWKPLDEFKGDPALHIDAETYVKRGEEVLPFIKKRVEVQDRKIADLEKTLKRATALLSTAESRSYAKAVADLKAQQVEAVEVGDVAAFQALDKKIEGLAKDVGAGGKPEYTEAEARGAFVDWREDNGWWDRGGLASATPLEADARAYTDRMIEKHIDKGNDMAPEEFFEYIGDLVHEKYPLLKAKPARQKPGSDVSAPTERRTGNGTKGYADLPADARQICESLIRRGVLPGKTETEKRAFYAANYDWNQK